MPNQQHLTPSDECNHNIVSNFYKALASRDAATVHRLLAPNIEWWFHGPPSCNRLMRLLTGCSTNRDHDDSFVFDPISIVSTGSVVLAEGCFPVGCEVSWVHAWTVTDGVITQVREYFNTSVTVTRFAKSDSVCVGSRGVDKCQCVWQSKLTDHASVPGLLLAV
ncbi:hypothetical protein SSX86_013210 [Deinandra increscens subsp. villosa]|uniref:Wound-induced protein 1 n=1 Tax=Deinandra increscens subsp. villosa TaxID=3103831 RepID=A0AAP0D622_9ASTR